MSTPKTMFLTALAMLAFAGNSLLCRHALGPGLIDAAGFTVIRVVSGAVMLALILAMRRQPLLRADPRAVLALFCYMVFFSFAYLSLSAGTGALVLFGAVQLSMFAVALGRGDNFPLLSWAGLVLAATGLVYLVAPGVTAPDPLGALLMAVAGIAWGAYSLLGRGAADPIAATASNFIYAVPLAALTALAFAGGLDVSAAGAALALASGALTSAIGYVLWYAALRGLSATSAATVQLSAPVIAAIGGVLLLGESLTPRLVLASAATLGGIAIVLTQRSRRADQGRSGRS